MNTKTFAQTARRILMEGVAQKLLYWGFTPEGEVVEEPVTVSGGYSFRGRVFDDATLPTLWKKLRSAIRKKGMEVIVEEAAYTWFNRIMALRIMAKNDYEEAQLSYVEGMEHTPIILQRARQGEYSFLNTTEQERLRNSIGDYNKDAETFALLLVGYCHNHQMLNNVFGKLDDYTELLLPDNILQENGFLHLLNTTDAISDDDYQKVELIGWLYQFYISERKDEVFASFRKKKKAEAKDIPAATQIFTPNWIVKYMVENTAGKLWLDKNPDSPLKQKMKYLVENDTSTSLSTGGQSEALINDVEELTLIDPACGSGHILVEGFDLLYQMYMEEYYTPEEAVESILTKNLYGLDIDDRAAQLATFAILLKAAQQYRDVFSKGWMPQVYAMPETQDFSEQEVKDFLGEEGEEYWEELYDTLLLMKQAKNLGSVMKLQLGYDAQSYIDIRLKDLQTNLSADFNVLTVLHKVKPFIPVLLLLTKKYSSVVANPPYMGSGTMNADLKSYVFQNYPLSRFDLFAVFMEIGLAFSLKKGLMGMINQHSWMFLSSFEKLRNEILEKYGIHSMLHLGARTFEELSGEVVQSTAFVLENGKGIEHATYHRLVDCRTIRIKEQVFLDKNKKYVGIPQANFINIPGSPIAYWASSQIIRLFDEEVSLDKLVNIRSGISTGNNDEYYRLWFEVSNDKIDFDIDEKSVIDNELVSSKKWFLIIKGGENRKWFGNRESVLNLENNGFDIRNSGRNFRLRTPAYYNKLGVTWSRISSGRIAFRIKNIETNFGENSPCFFIDGQENYYISLLNSKVVFHILSFINPTLTFQVIDVAKIPVIVENSKIDTTTSISECNKRLVQTDWDSRETSWDFEKSPFLNETDTLINAYQTWQEKVTQDFFQLHANEEELNRIFINIYGLKDEMTTDVVLKDITILQDELDRKALEALEPTFREQGKDAIELPINKGEVIRQFISYCIGIFMGRYRLDKDGLNIAHPNPTAEELETYTYNQGEVEIDEDAILPIMGTNCNFPDDAVLRINELLDTIWGHEVRTENINFIQDCLNKDLDKFLVKDFYKYHCKMYKKKPIYWLFSSKKGAFQVLVYMHRMNEFTAEKIRANYLLEHLKQLRSERDLLQSSESSLNTQQARRLEQLSKDIPECEAYDMELKNVADQQIKFDLDDGVTANYELFEKVVAKI